MGWSAEGVVSQVLHQLETYTAALLCAIGFLTGAGAMLYGAAVVDVMREKKNALYCAAQSNAAQRLRLAQQGNQATAHYRVPTLRKTK